MAAEPIKLFLIVLIAVLMVAIGFVLGRSYPTGVAETKSEQTEAVAKPMQPIVNRRFDVESYFKSLELESIVLDYSGGDFLFWVVLETEGKTTEVFREPIEAYHVTFRSTVADSKVLGRFIFVRGVSDSSGIEKWQMKFTRDFAGDERPSLPQGGETGITSEQKVWSKLAEATGSASSPSKPPIEPKNSEQCIYSQAKWLLDKDGQEIERIRIAVYCKALE